MSPNPSQRAASWQSQPLSTVQQLPHKAGTLDMLVKLPPEVVYHVLENVCQLPWPF